VTTNNIDVRVLIRLSAAELDRRVREARPGDATGWVGALRNEAGRYYHTDAAAARGIANRALELAEMIGDPLALGWGHRAVAESLLFSGKILEADASYAKAADAWRKAGVSGFWASSSLGISTFSRFWDAIAKPRAPPATPGQPGSRGRSDVPCETRNEP
jgi:hypothetical protein